MNDNTAELDATDEETLTDAVSDDALEAAAGNYRRDMTLVFCSGLQTCTA